MSTEKPIKNDAGHYASPAAADQSATTLHGRMGAIALAFTVLAFNGPLAAVAGYLAFVIYFNGIGAPLMFVAAGVITLIFAVGFTTMSKYLPNPGAFYSYITAGLGRVWGLGGAFLAVLAYAFVLLGVYAFFGVVANGFVTGLGGPDIPWYWYSLLVLMAVGITSYLNISVSAKVLFVALALELVVVLVFNVAVLLDGGPQGLSLEPFSFGAALQQNVGISLLFAVSLFLGFEATAIFREEVKNPLKTVPRATYLAVGMIIVMYVLTSFFLVSAYGVDNAAAVAQEDPAGMFLGALETFLGSVAVDIASVLLITSLFAALLSISNVLSRYLFSLGNDGVLPRPLGRVHPRQASPYISSIVVTVAILVGGIVLIAGGFDPGLAYGSLAGVGGFAVIVLELITSVAVFAYFRKTGTPKESSVWKTVVAPVVAAVGLALIVYLAISNFPTLIGGDLTLAVVLQVVTWGALISGMALAAHYRRTKPEVYERIGRQNV